MTYRTDQRSPKSSRAMRFQRRSAVLRTGPCFTVPARRAAAAIARGDR